MKKNLLILAGLFLVMGSFISLNNCSSASGEAWQSDIKWTDPGSITADQIKQTGKPVFIFFHTDWCTFCKKMEQGTFADAKVQKILNERFVNMAINPEKEGSTAFLGDNMSFAQLAGKLNISVYPVSAFFDSESGFIGQQPGYLSEKQMTDLIEYIGYDFYKKMTFQEFQDLTPAARHKI